MSAWADPLTRWADGRRAWDGRPIVGLVEEARNPWVGERLTSYRFDVLDADENLLYELRDVEAGGSLTWDASAAVKGAGKITVEDLRDPDVDWLTVRIKPWIVVNGNETPLGVYLCSVLANRQYTEETKTFEEGEDH